MDCQVNRYRFEEKYNAKEEHLSKENLYKREDRLPLILSTRVKGV